TLETKIISDYESLLSGQVGRAFRHTTVSMVMLSLSESITLAAAALVFWYGSRLMVDGELAVKDYFVVYMALIFGGESSGQFFAFSPSKFSFFFSLLIINRKMIILHRYGHCHFRREPHFQPSAEARNRNC